MATTIRTTSQAHRRAPVATPRFGGILWRLARLTSPATKPLAGKRWNPIWAVVEHRGRRTGRAYSAPVAARRVRGGFIISLAFGPQVDWYRNLVAANGGTIRWRGSAFRVGTPEPIDTAAAFAAFNAVQRLLLRIGGIDNFVHVADDSAPAT